MNDLKNTILLISEVIEGVAGVCYHSPLVEETAKGINGIRFFFRGATGPMKSLVIDYLQTLDDIVGVEFFMGEKCYTDSPGEFLVTFSKTVGLAQVLPVVKDFLEGKAPELDGVRVSKT